MNNQNFNFQVFEQTGGKFKNVRISLNNSGGIGLLAGFWNKYKLEKYNYVLLFADLKRKAIAFKFLNDAKQPGVYKLTKNRSSASVSPNAFFAANDINPKKYVGTYIPKEYCDNNHGTLFYIILQEQNAKKDKIQ